MKINKYSIVFLIFLFLASLACSVQKIQPKTVIPSATKINPTPTATCTKTEIPKTFAIVNAEIGLNLREEATENSKSLYILKDGNNLVVHSILENGWICVTFVDSNKVEYFGYVNGKYIDILE